ncbi:MULTISPECIES: TadE/TadG family type IV pilus assembly protein [Agrobacterium tumefaciens complex]|jgi:Flp pilus assembly protein TadG|uniref:TadE/TadG family type IV pilus assembly protein n=1 Tax=Agrobacterium tumefaciens TaxID=358 RepID=UPI000FE296E3|nr:TadE/TadG family type IV pilus assembly protein [Agrobacterium tumefaciens]QAB00913.1 pilus assembly protein TadE [Agrobacterium tumefaciens]
MKCFFLNLTRERSGTAAIEFALVLPVFLLLLFGMIEFARLFWTTHALHETAIATARCMGIPQTECEDGGVYSSDNAIAFAKNKAAGWLIQLDSVAIALDRNSSCHGLEGLSRVEIEYRFTTVMPSFLTSLAGGTQLKAEACYTNY